MYNTIIDGFFTRVLYNNQVVVGEIVAIPGGYLATDYRSVGQVFNLKPLAIGWIISRAKRRKSREKVNGSVQKEELGFFV